MDACWLAAAAANTDKPESGSVDCRADCRREGAGVVVDNDDDDDDAEAEAAAAAAGAARVCMGTGELGDGGKLDRMDVYAAVSLWLRGSRPLCASDI
jgi:hypothetical protein